MKKSLFTLLTLSLLLTGCLKKSTPIVLKPTPPPKPVNQIEVKDRPYVTIQPLSSRNDLQITINELKLPAKSVEVTLEYDRNKGVLDAVLRQFMLVKFPFKETIFLGSKSAGGHITYHEDVIGGTLTLDFKGEDSEYVLEVPWRYADTQKEYSQLSTTDGKFQVTLTKPIKQSKVVVMQSPGLPKNIETPILAGPYLIRTVGELPKISAEISLRLNEEKPTAKIIGWDGTKWQNLTTKVDGKTLTTTGNLMEVYLATE